MTNESGKSLNQTTARRHGWTEIICWGVGPGIIIGGVAMALLSPAAPRQEYRFVVLSERSGYAPGDTIICNYDCSADLGDQNAQP